MHKKALFFFLFISLIFISSLSYAAVTTVSKSTSTAVAALTGTGSVNMSIELLKLSGGSTTQIYWDTAGINLGTTTWRRADSYILLNATFTSATGGIQIYTDNKNAATDPYVGVSTAAGLVCISSPSANPLPTCWRIVATSTNTLTIKEIGGGGSLYADEIGDTYRCFLFVKDKSDGGFVEGSDDITIEEWARGIHHAEGSWGQEPSPNYIYIGADFTNAESGKTYKCSTLRIEAFTE